MEKMKNQDVDRRVQRTRKLLNEALMTLITEQGYDSITVQNIIDRANLGRSTFYAHYQDKDDLLLSGMEDVVHSLLWGDDAPHEEAGRSGQGKILSALPIFRHAQEQYDLHRAIMGGRGIDLIIKTIQDHLSSHIQDRIERLVPDDGAASVPPVVMASFLAGSLMTLLRWWLDNDMPHPPERMDEMFQALAMPGVWVAMRGKG